MQSIMAKTGSQVRPYLTQFGIIIVSILSLSLSVYSQEECATPVPQSQIQFEQALMNQGVDYTSRRAFVTAYDVPLAIHIVRRADGTGGFTSSQLTLAMIDLNAQFVQVGWTYSIAGAVDYIDDDFWYFNTNTFANFDLLKQVNVVPSAINVYFAPNTGYCGVSSFTSSAVQGIIMDNACAGVSTNNSTFAHEVGHYVNLYHTHESFIGVECPDGSNCSSAGDLLCDTPADPVLSGHVNPSTCAYDNAVAPPGGCGATAYNPQTDNLMSYSTKMCRDLFTPDQINKMIFTIENFRPELSLFWGGLSVTPSSIAPLSVGTGASKDTSITVYHNAGGTTTLTGYSTSLPGLTIAETFPIPLTDVDSFAFTVSFDASSLGTECDIGLHYDTIVIATTAGARPEIRVPVEIAVSFQAASPYNITLSTSCLQAVYPNTPGIGDSDPNAFTLGGVNGLYDASLLLGIIDGIDTIVYRDLYSTGDFAVVDSFTSEVLPDGRLAENLRFATNDGKLHGTVRYIYEPSLLAECGYIVAEYEVFSACDTNASIELLAGVFADFDIVNSNANHADYDSINGLVFVSESYGSVSELQTSVRACAIMDLTGTPRNLRAIDNQIYVYPTSGLINGEIFQQMAMTTNNSGGSDTDWSALMTSGLDTLTISNSMKFAVALLYSDAGTNKLASVASSAIAYYNPTACCVGTVGNVNNDPGEIVDIGDLTDLIDYLFISNTVPVCLYEANVNDSPDGFVDIGDLTQLIAWLFIAEYPLPACP